MHGQGAGFDPEAETVVPDAGPRGLAVSDEDTALGATLASAPPKENKGRLARGQAIGRFIVIDRLGAGAMGEVVAAYDPDLHRRVAIKVLRLGEGAHPGVVSAATERMVREARAMAQLSHPHVITVFEVDELEPGQVFIAMEFVDGGTLRSWAEDSDGPRPWREVLEVYAQAGRGLAGAHAVGMVHRDFKPENLLIGSDGRVRVTDFGLVGVDPSVGSSILSGTDPSMESGQAATASSSAVEALVEATLTRTGAVMGTPAYMAPEQDGGRADARSDQFSFCVALYEALYGERPFAGDTLAVLRTNVAKGRMRGEPRDSGVPGWVRTVVLRGLSTDPQERWPDMTALLDQLGRDPTVRRRQWIMGGSGGLVLAGVTGWSIWSAASAEDPCQGGAAKIAEIWNEDRSTVLREAFVAAAPEAGEDAHRTLEEAVDGFAERWVDAHRQACEATLVRHEQSDQLFDRRMRCLDQRSQRVDILLGVFETPTAESVAKADAAAGSLPSLDRCADAEALEAEIPPPEDPKRREAWDRLHHELDRADALGVAGKEIASLALYESLAPEVNEVDHPPLTARLQLNYGNALVRQQRWTEAIAVLEPGPATAAQGGDATVEAQMWLLLAKAHGFGLNESKTGATMARAAEVAAVRAGENPELQIGIQYTMSLLRDADGDYEEAVSYAERAVELAEKTHGREHRTTSTLYGQLGSILDHAGRYDEAMEAHETSMAIDTAMHGPDHPDVGHSLISVGMLHQNRGEYDAAEQNFERALAIYRETVGPKHGAYATALLDLAGNSMLRQRHQEARERFEKLLEIYAETRPEVHDDVAMVHQNLGSAFTHLGDLDQAEEHYRRAYRIRQQVFGDEHPKVMHSINAMAQSMARRGELEAAEVELRRAVEIGEKGLPRDHPDLAYPLQNLANVLAEQERYDEAIPLLERTVKLRADIDPNLLGRSEAALARVLWFTDRPRAEKMFEQAAAKMDELGRKEIEMFKEMVQGQ